MCLSVTGINVIQRPPNMARVAVSDGKLHLISAQRKVR